LADFKVSTVILGLGGATGVVVDGKGVIGTGLGRLGGLEIIGLGDVCGWG